MADVVGTADVLIRAVDRNFAGDVRNKVRAATSAAEKDASIKATMDTKGIEEGSARARTSLDTVKSAAIAIGGALASAKLGDFLSDLGRTAVGLDTMAAKSRTVFEGATADVTRWARANAAAMGLTDQQLRGLAANLGDLLKPMGFTSAEAAKMSQEVLTLAGALSAWSGGQRTAAEVAQIVQSAMLGEREALKSLGVAISEADVQARLAAKGQQELTGAALEQAKAVATMELIFEKSGDAQKAWADGSLDAAKNSNRLKAALAEVREELASKLGPAAEYAGEAIGTLGPAVAGVGSIMRARREGELERWGPTLATIAINAGKAIPTLLGMAAAAYAGKQAGDALAGSGESVAQKIDRQINRVPYLGDVLQNLRITHRTTGEAAEGHAKAEGETAVEIEKVAAAAEMAQEKLDALAMAQEANLDAGLALTAAHHAAWEAAVRVTEAEQKYAEVLAESGPGTAAAEKAEISLEGARQRQVEVLVALADRMRDADVAQREAEGGTVSASEKTAIFRDRLLEVANTVEGPLRDQLLALAGNIRNLPDKTVTITADTASAEAAVARLQGRINALDFNIAAIARGEAGQPRQHGGPVVAGGRYRVGEVGEEELIMFPGGGGYVLPVGARTGGDGSNATVHVNMPITVTGAGDPQATAVAVRNAVASQWEFLLARLSAGTGTRLG